MELRDNKGLTEKEFLAIYAKKNYPRPYLTADVVFHDYKFSIYIDPWRNRPDGKCGKIGSGV